MRPHVVEAEELPVHQPHPEANLLFGSAIGLAHLNNVQNLNLQHARPIDWHVHPGLEILCCISGVLNYEFAKRPPVALTAGQYLVVPQGVVHRIMDGIDEPNHRISFILSKQSVASARTRLMTGQEYRDFYADLLMRRCRPRPFSRSVKEKLLQLAVIVDQGEGISPRERIEARIGVTDVLLSLAAAPRQPPPKSQVRMMDEAVAYLERHFREKVSVDRLADFMGYGRSSLFMLFRDCTGLTPVEWLTKRRIDEAKRLLASGEKVVRTAKSCGFNDVSFFSRTFRYRTGQTPGEYARKMGKRRSSE